MRGLLFIACLLLSHSALALDGEALYTDNCSVCHGTGGSGGVGIPLALKAFQQQASDDYIRHTIRYGRPGRVMPAFNRLSDAEVDAIIHYIRSLVPGIQAPVWKTATVKGNPQQGEKLFKQHCVACHGDHAQGGTGTGLMFSRPRALPITAPALNNPGFLHAATDEMIKHIITQGRSNTPMPAAASMGLKADDINDIVSYLRSLEKPLPEDTIDQEPAVLVYESPYSFDETVKNVKRAAVGMNFRLIREQSLDYGLAPKDQEMKHKHIVYFCNFKFLYDALSIDPRVGMFLPCRVTVVEDHGKVKVMSINPKRLSHIFNNNQLDKACKEMENVYTSILEEATL